MRVAIISYHTSPLASLGSSAAGGMNVYVRRLAEGIADRGVEVDIFTRRDSLDSPRELEFTPGARVMTVRAGPIRHLSKAQLAAYAPAFAHSLARLSNATRRCYDVIHSHYWLSGLAAQTLRTADQPLVHMFHTLSRVKQHYQPDAGRGDPPSRDYGERTLLKSKHTLVFSTDAEVEDVENMYGFRPASVAIIPPGVDGDRFAPRPAEEARRLLGLRPGPLVLFVGRMDRAKGVDLLLQAISQLRQSGGWQDLQVVVVGGDDHNRDAVAHCELDRLHAIVRELGLENTVAFKGVVPQEELPLYYAACDLCAVPSQYESFGMVALEAMSSGRPVVGFRSRGLEQTMRDGRVGFLVDSGDVEALAGAMGRILSDHCLGCRMGIAARESVKGFSWHRVAESTIGLYTSLLQETTDTRSALRSS